MYLIRLAAVIFEELIFDCPLFMSKRNSHKQTKMLICVHARVPARNQTNNNKMKNLEIGNRKLKFAVMLAFVKHPLPLRGLETHNKLAVMWIY